MHSEPIAPNLVIRADASFANGTGHVMRCLALAQAWRRLGRTVTFAQAESLPPLTERLRQEGCKVLPIEAAAGSLEDADRTVEIAREQAAGWIVADGYKFGADWQQRARQGPLRLLVINDLPGEKRHFADVVLNQNLPAPELMPAKAAYPRLLFGPAYALLRDEFARLEPAIRRPPELARKILVTLGGSDPANATEVVVEALQTLPCVDVTVVAGVGNRRRAFLAERVRALGPAWRLLVNPPDMPALMSAADLAVSAAGSTCWELARVGTPMALLILAPNQVPVANTLTQLGAAAHIGTHPTLDARALALAIEGIARSPEARQALAARASSLVDGLGRLRVIAQMRAIELTLRRAAPRDAELIWQWANDAEVRMMSFHSEPIPWPEHQAWFARKLADPNCHFFLAFAGSQPIGQIRFEADGAAAAVSVSLASQARGHGWGPSLIRAGCDRLEDAPLVREIHALIKKENRASQQAFRLAGFVPAPSPPTAPADALHLRLLRHS